MALLPRRLLGSGGAIVLADGRYVISSPLWGSDDPGAVTWGSSTSVGAVTDSNSMIGRKVTVNGTTTGENLSAGKIVTASANAPAAVAVTGMSLPIDGARVEIADGVRVPVTTTLASSTVQYSDFSGQSLTISPTQLADWLNAGTGVSLQANNDITLKSNLTATATTSAGLLTMQAGRSILLNANLATTGDVELVANDAGALSGNRDPGEANITMDSGTSIAASGKTVTLRIAAGDTTRPAGNIDLGTISAAKLVLDSPKIAIGVYTNPTKVYDGSTALSGTAQSLSYTLDDADPNRNGIQGVRVGGNAATIVATGVAYADANAGTDKTLTSDAAYRLDDTTGQVVELRNNGVTLTLPLKGDITPKSINLAGAKTYDGTSQFAASLLTVSGQVDNETVPLQGSVSAGSANQGTYTSVNASDLQVTNPNYAFTNGSAVSLRIDPRNLSLSGFKLYDATGLFLASQLVPRGLMAGETLLLDGSLSVVGNSPGVYGYSAIRPPVTLTLNNANYQWGPDSEVNLMIAPGSPIPPAASAPREAGASDNRTGQRLPLDVRGTGINLPANLANR